MTVIALLRGINVGGNNKVPMAQLKALLESLGLKNVRTLLQSGNAVFECASTKGLDKKIEDELEKTFGFRPKVILRTADELRDVAGRNPFAGREDVEGNRLLITFLAGDPNPVKIDAPIEEVHIIGREMYVHFPDGVGQSKFPFAKAEKKLGVAGTARNWNTVLKLIEMS